MSGAGLRSESDRIELVGDGQGEPIEPLEQSDPGNDVTPAEPMDEPDEATSSEPARSIPAEPEEDVWVPL